MKILTPTLAAMLLVCTTTSAMAQETLVPHLSVSGQAEIEVAADQVEFRLGVESQDSNADSALHSNSVKMDKILAVLKAKGMTDKEFQTGRFSINPQWQPRPKNPPVDWAPTIVGYRVTNQINIKTSQFAKVGDWIATATKQGANTAGQLNFGLKDPDAHRGQAIREATLRAKEYASQAADAAGVKLKQILSLQIDGAGFQPIIRPQLMRAEMAMAKSDAYMAPAIDPGEIKVNATVTVSYEIR